MTIGRIIAFICVTFIVVSEVVHAADESVKEEKPTPGAELNQVIWESAKKGKLPPNAQPAGEELTIGGNREKTYVARAIVPQFGTAIIPGYFSSFTKEVVITGLEGGPYFRNEYEVLTSKPKWTRINNDETIPLKAVPVGRFGDFEPIYSCRAEINGIKRIGVMWWGQKFCHILLGSADENGSYEYQRDGMHEYEMLVA